MSRAAAIERFLAAGGRAGARVVPLAGDASFRRYLRLDGRGEVLMDAPPEHGEDVRPFVAVARLLAGAGLRAPAILAEDAAQGLLLLEDMGDLTYARALDAGADPERLYAAAVDVLAALHRVRPPAWLPHYYPDLLDEETALFADWYLPAVRGRPTPEAERAGLLAALAPALAEAARAPAVVVLRDYHAETLIWLADRDPRRRVGLLDFQDAAAGPAPYDLASLLEDARRDVAPDLAARMVARYLDAAGAGVDPAAFGRAYAAVAAQRHLKVAGIFTRLARRDAKPGYLGHLPRVLAQLDAAAAAPGLEPLRAWLERALGDRRPVPAPL